MTDKKVVLSPTKYVLQVNAPLFSEYLKNKEKERTPEELKAILNELETVQNELSEAVNAMTYRPTKRRYKPRQPRTAREEINDPSIQPTEPDITVQP